MSDPAPIEPAQPPLWSLVRIALLVASVPTGLLAVLGIAVGCAPGLFGIDEPMWILAGFELVMLATAVFVGLVAAGRFAAGRPLTLGMASAAIAICAVLESLSLNHTVGETSLRPFLFGRLAAAGVIGLAVLPLTLVSGDQWRRLLVGVVVLSPVAALAAPIVLTRVGIPAPDVLGQVTALLDRAGPAVSLFLTLLGGLAGIVILSMGGHLVITAFDPRYRTSKAAGAASE